MQGTGHNEMYTSTMGYTNSKPFLNQPMSYTSQIQSYSMQHSNSQYSTNPYNTYYSSEYGHCSNTVTNSRTKWDNYDVLPMDTASALDSGMYKDLTVLLPEQYPVWQDIPANPAIGYRIVDVTKLMREDYRYYCDICTKGFFDKALWHTHLAGHVQCTYSGCKFICHKTKIDLMDTHVELLHNRVNAPDFSNPAQYRAERLKRYPSIKNISIKIEELYLQALRGEHMSKAQVNWLSSHDVFIDSNGKVTRGGERPQLDVKPQKRDRAIPTESKGKNLVKNVSKHNETKVQEIKANAELYQVPRSYKCTGCKARGAHWSKDCSTFQSKELSVEDSTVDQSNSIVKKLNSTTKEGIINQISTNKAKKSRKEAIVRKRKHTLYEKLVQDQITIERGLVLKCIGYFIDKNFFQ